LFWAKLLHARRIKSRRKISACVADARSRCTKQTVVAWEAHRCPARKESLTATEANQAAAAFNLNAA
jgi:hypothetical protein